MTVIIRNGRFAEDDYLEEGGAFIDLDQYSRLKLTPDFDHAGLHLTTETDPRQVAGFINSVNAIRVHFPSFADGRGFSLARSLRRMGYTGRLRAHGHVLADQYPLALRSGFDEVEIPNELAGRQPQSQWIEAYGRISGTYLERLREGHVAA